MFGTGRQFLDTLCVRLQDSLVTVGDPLVGLVATQRTSTQAGTLMADRVGVRLHSMTSDRKPTTVYLQVDGFDVEVVFKWEGSELLVDKKLVDEYKGFGLAIPFLQGTRLTAKPKSGTYIEAFVRNLGIGSRLEVRLNGQLIHSQYILM